MRKTTLIACFIFLPVLAGCTVSDALFGVFGGNYTGGGYTRADREYDYNQRVEASQTYGSLNP
ncbi:MAG: hypothetical protein O3C40_35060 [Planctomycetota bacterium]|nr:hypothetical protein [Planctomycetota bacterium]